MAARHLGQIFVPHFCFWRHIFAKKNAVTDLFNYSVVFQIISEKVLYDHAQKLTKILTHTSIPMVRTFSVKTNYRNLQTY